MVHSVFYTFNACNQNVDTVFECLRHAITHHTKLATYTRLGFGTGKHKIIIFYTVIAILLPHILHSVTSIMFVHIAKSKMHHPAE